MTEKMEHQVTYEDLAALMKSTAGVTVDPQVLEQQADRGFDTFGLDSLGLLGIVGELDKRHGRPLPDQADHCKTPATFMALVNRALVKGA
jgi:minimal PKS acyl carrier protein